MNFSWIPARISTWSFLTVNTFDWNCHHLAPLEQDKPLAPKARQNKLPQAKRATLHMFQGSECRMQFRKWKTNIPGSKLLLGGEERLSASLRDPGTERKCGPENKWHFWWKADSKVHSQASRHVHLSQKRATALQSDSARSQHPNVRVPDPRQQLDTGQTPHPSRADWIQTSSSWHSAGGLCQGSNPVVLLWQICMLMLQTFLSSVLLPVQRSHIPLTPQTNPRDRGGCQHLTQNAVLSQMCLSVPNSKCAQTETSLTCSLNALHCALSGTQDPTDSSHWVIPQQSKHTGGCSSCSLTAWTDCPPHLQIQPGYFNTWTLPDLWSLLSPSPLKNSSWPIPQNHSII